MANTYFRFKQFTVHQEHCAMKVCTDACLFGAWVAGKLKNEQPRAGHILDIGTGTGLLALMLAQQTTASIDAVEIDNGAALQAAQNFSVSPWASRLSLYHAPLQEFDQPGKSYDMIICNPPFFEDDLRSPDAKRNLALHSAALSLDVLIALISSLLKDNGSFAILLPFRRSNYFESLAMNHSFYLQEKILVKQSPKHNFFRSMLRFQRIKPLQNSSGEMIITGADKKYTAAFTALLEDYYLDL